MITSTSNPTVKAVRRLHRARGRREQRRTLAEGPNGLEAVRRHGVPVAEVLCLSDDTEAREFSASIGHAPTLVSAEVLAAVSDTPHPRSPVVVIDLPSPGPVRPVPTVVLVDVADPGNVGTIVRSAAAFGWDVASIGATADVWSPKAIRSSAAATLGVHVSRPTDLAEVEATGLALVALSVDGGTDPHTTDPDGPPALLVGSEAHGLDDAVLARVPHRMTIPMRGPVDSLNAGVAASIAMHALGRQWLQ